ncbi:MAG: exonuclease SbcCD subunit D C-terminal domain-containing protein [Verrucomicrobiaceae bacterium]|nr:exonuclease SbcCD subunit D C-terminal domain-containing protein [Verrucomicrobiaceae bacterium]
MILLHTADWHLGARLVERDRLPEHASFLDWLIDVVKSEKVDALLLSGDVFDAANPPQEAVALYYDFIRRVADLKSVRMIITGGNHDSASHLNAPRDLLQRFHVHVFGQAVSPEDASVNLGDVVVGAVPFLRERDLRHAVAGESMGDAQTQVKTAIQRHYSEQLTACQSIANGRPIIAMGHLTVLGSSHSDSERDIHVGNLGAIGAEIFSGFDYTALGHLHRAQKVAGLDAVRYSGSPIPLSFSEAGDEKSVVIIRVAGKRIEEIRTLPIPTSRLLVRPTADRADLEEVLAKVPAGSWAEITVKMELPEAELERQVRTLAADRFEVLKVLAELPASQQPAWQNSGPALNELQPRDVFHEKLKEAGIDQEDAELNTVFQELIALHEALQTA